MKNECMDEISFDGEIVRRRLLVICPLGWFSVLSTRYGCRVIAANSHSDLLLH